MLIDGQDSKIFPGQGITAKGPLGEVILKQFFYVSGVEPTQEELNEKAQLFNAAPELLETLKEQVALFWMDLPEYERESFRHRYSPDHPIVRAEAAIAKAEGGE